MREILFRGKRIDSGEWVEGGCRAEKVGDYITAVSIMEHLGHGVWNVCRVDHATVGQYTGLTDKNGKKIFEGDILKGICGMHIVFFDERFACFDWREIKGKPTENFSGFADEYEIVGNIHDNPELLEVSHETD